MEPVGTINASKGKLPLSFTGNHPKSRLTVLHMFSGDLWAGAEVMIFNLLDQLKDDQRVKMIALSLNEGILTNKLRNLGIETHVIPESEYAFPMIACKALKILIGKRIDIIHSHRYKENLAGFLLAKARGIRGLVTTIHGLSEPLLQSKNELGDRIKTRMNHVLVNRYFQRVVAVSQDIKRILVQEHRFRQELVEVIYNGVALRSPSPSFNRPGSDVLHVGTVGRMVPVKDFNLFLEIATAILKRTNKVRFSILGDGPQKLQLIERARDLNLEGSIEFVSPMPDPQSYYESLDLYVNTSLHEGIPLSILDAMACGKPVVAPSVGGIPEIISHREDGVLVQGRDPKDFAGSCLEILQDESLRISMGGQALRKVAARFSGLKMAESYRQLYLSSCAKY